jgi:CheY-like chemotaxis protein
VSAVDTLPHKKEMPVSALVVDDSMLIRHTVCRFLEDRGFSVESASNGEEALEYVNRRIPSIIITDMQMPRMTGSQLITALKTKSETSGIPVIILAGKSSGFDNDEKRAAFAIFKDIDIETQLANALDAVLGDHAMKKTASC